MKSFFVDLSTPLRGPLLVFMATSVAILFLVLNGGLFALPLALTFLAALAALILATIDATAHGMPVPVLSIEMLNPLHDSRALFAGILLGSWVALVATAAHSTGARTAAALGVGAVLILPGQIAVLSISERLLAALSPFAVVGLIRALGVRYVLFILAAVTYGGLLLLALGRTPLLVYILLVEAALLSLAAALGGLLFGRRDAVGLITRDAVTLADAEAQRRAEAEREQVLHDAYGILRGGNGPGAWKVIETWLRDRANPEEDLQWLLTRTAAWPDRRIADRIVRDLVSAQLRGAQGAKALDAAERWLNDGGQFRATSARELAKLVGIARMSDRVALAERLLDASAPAFASDPEIQAIEMKRRTAAEDRRRG